MQKRAVELSVADAVSRQDAPARSDDEISLVDLWLVVRKRWTWLLAGLLLGVAAAIAYATLTTPIYESRASIQIGKVPDVGSLEDFNALAVSLMDQYGADSNGDNEQKMPYLKQPTQEPGKANILRLVTIGRSPEEAKNFLTQIIAKLMQRHQQIYGNAIQPLQRRLAAIDSQVKLLAAQVAELSDLVDRLKESNPVQASLVAIERGRTYAELNELERDRVVLQQKSTQPYSSPSAVVVRPALPGAPVAPRKAVGLAVGIMLGLMLGLFAVFLGEFVIHVRRAKTDTRSVKSGVMGN